MQRRFLHDDLESGKCFFVEYTGGSSPRLIRREISREQFTAASMLRRREDLTEAERGALIARVLDPIPAEMKKAGA